MYTTNLFNEMKNGLFHRMDTDDLISCLFTTLINDNYISLVSNNDPTLNKPLIIRNQEDKHTIKVRPSSDNLNIVCCDIFHKIYEFYNKEYWLISLWLAMYADSKNSSIAREITRGFILNCISQTAHDLLGQNIKQITSKDISNTHLSKTDHFYSRAFDIRNVLKKMRTQRFQKINGVSIQTNLKDKQIDIDKTQIINLFRSNGLEKFSDIVKEATVADNGQDIKGLISFMGFYFSQITGRSKIKKQIRLLLQGS
jgi:hypothetical protein